MTFIANLNGNRVVSLDYSNEDWLTLKREYRESRLICNDENCQTAMIPKTYHKTGTQFFSHKNKNEGVRPCKYSGSESPEHLYLKAYIYETLKGMGLHPELEVTISEVNRRADLIVGNNVFEIQLSQQSIEDYEIRSQDYRDAEKQVYWIVFDTHLKLLHTHVTYPVVFLNGKPDLSPDYEPYIEMYDAFTHTPTTMSLNAWIERTLNYEYKWTKDCIAYPDKEHWCCINGACDIELERKKVEEVKRKTEEAKRQDLLQGVRKLFTQYWGFIEKATDEFPLGVPPKEAFHKQIQQRYNTDFKNLLVGDLESILQEIVYYRIDNLLQWLYPNHGKRIKAQFGEFWGFTPQGRRTYNYALKLYRAEKNKQFPKCACPNKYYTMGASRRKNGVYVAHRYCERCGCRSSEAVGKKKFQHSVIRNAHEWVEDIVNFKKTDHKPWLQH